MNFEDLTIVLTPHNRPLHLRRVLEYYKNWDVNIIIMDSSLHEFTFKESITKNMSYYFQPNEMYANKLKFAVDKVKTSFAMIQAEDDFYTPSGLKSSINFLKSNPDYASCQGMFSAFTFNPIKKKTVYYQSYNRDIDEQKVGDRIKSIMGSYFQLFYAVHRKENLKAIFNFTSERIKNLFLIEILIGFFALIEGKHKVLKTFYGVREIIPASAGRNPFNFNQFVTDSVTKIEYNKILDELACIISKIDSVTKTDSLIQLKEATQLYLDGTAKKLTVLKQFERRIHKLKTDAEIKKESPNYTIEWNEIKKYIKAYPVN